MRNNDSDRKVVNKKVVNKMAGHLTTYADGAVMFQPRLSTGEKIYTSVHMPLKGAVLQQSAHIYKISVSTPISTPHPARVLRKYFDAAVAKLESVN